jgi:hypothetical protein
MMRNWMAVVGFVGAVLVGCGGTEAATDGETLDTVAGALATCSTQCSTGVTLSCAGGTCSAQDGVSVQCDGAYQYCPSNCQWFTGVADTSYADACASALQQGTSYCAAHGGTKSRSRLCVHDSNTPPYAGQYYFCCNR